MQHFSPRHYAPSSPARSRQRCHEIHSRANTVHHFLLIIHPSRQPRQFGPHSHTASSRQRNAFKRKHKTRTNRLNSSPSNPLMTLSFSIICARSRRIHNRSRRLRSRLSPNPLSAFYECVHTTERGKKTKQTTRKGKLMTSPF
jgi:hypothetical protein